MQFRNVHQHPQAKLLVNENCLRRGNTLLPAPLKALYVTERKYILELTLYLLDLDWGRTSSDQTF